MKRRAEMLEGDQSDEKRLATDATAAAAASMELIDVAAVVGVVPGKRIEIQWDLELPLKEGEVKEGAVDEERIIEQWWPCTVVAKTDKARRPPGTCTPLLRACPSMFASVGSPSWAQKGWATPP